MKLPQLDAADQYQGLYVFDFGEWTAVGYTAEEIAMLLESEQYAKGKVYRICRATPDGQMELRGVAHERFLLESGMLFNRESEDAARDDFATLRQLAEQTPPPCRTFLHLADRGEDAEFARYVTALIYPAEFDDDIASWLLALDYAGGDTVEGGPSHVTNYYEDRAEVLERVQLWSRKSTPSRSHNEVMASVRVAVQR